MIIPPGFCLTNTIKLIAKPATQLIIIVFTPVMATMNILKEIYSVNIENMECLTLVIASDVIKAAMSMKEESMIRIPNMNMEEVTMTEVLLLSVSP